MGAELGQRHIQGFQAGLHDVVNRLINFVFVERLRTVDKEFEQLRQVDGLRPRFQDPALTAGIDIAVSRQFFQKLAQFVKAHIDMPSELLHRQRLAVLLGRIEQQQDFQYIVKAAARIQTAAERFAAPVGQGRG